MTREEQFTTICEKIGPSAKDFKPMHLSVLLLTSLMEELCIAGLLNEKPITINESGRDAVRFCKEEGWHPSDGEIIAFCQEVVPPQHIMEFVMILTQMRDNHDEYLEKAKQRIAR